jgi:hypothetical protein
MHNILNTVTGASVISGYAAAGLFNLNTRKLTKASEAQIETLMQAAIPSLAPPAAR